MSGLTDEQLAFYKEEGYLLIEDVLPPQVFQLLISEVERDIDQRAREAQRAGRLEDLYEDQPFERRLARICTTLEGEADSFWSFSGDKYKSEGMFLVMTHPAILDIVESVIGPEILAHPQFNLRAGGVLLTQHKIAHRSIANTSDHIRWSLDLRYSDPAMPTGRDSVPGFIARSAANPQSVATGLADWLKRMETV